ncbi:MAG TPA: class I SAM-dependent methyltransferase [Phycisphaerae bacterium]|nr:class I SAM-dependent methyltransferase [Phycisphaerae bacterium]
MEKMKSSNEEIRKRFDKEVERFSNLETGQTAVMDSPLAMDLVTRAAAAVTPNAFDVLDVGCGAGNYTLKLLEILPRLNCTLLDLSKPMLDRAVQRVQTRNAGVIRPLQVDIRDADLGEHSFDIIMTAVSLHHLRTDAEWRACFVKLFRALRPDGSLWIFDMIAHDHEPIQQLMRNRWGQYLQSQKSDPKEGVAYRDEVFAYVEKEDSPRPLLWQIDLMRQVGFVDIEVLHKNSLFAAFGGRRRGSKT